MEKMQLQNYHVHYGPAKGLDPCRPARAVALQGPDLAVC